MEYIKYNIIVSEKAKYMLGLHIKFLAKVNKEAASNKKAQILKAIRSLSVLPEKYPFFDNEFISKNKYHKLYVENYSLILYQIKERIVYVDYILDCRKDYKWLVNH